MEKKPTFKNNESLRINIDTFNDFKYVFVASSDRKSIIRIDSKGNIDVVSDRNSKIEHGKIDLERDIKIVMGTPFSYEVGNDERKLSSVGEIKPVDIYFEEPLEGTTKGGFNTDAVEKFYHLYYIAIKSKQRSPDEPFTNP